LQGCARLCDLRSAKPANGCMGYGLQTGANLDF
jgi:hypothetical protein